MKKTTYIYIVLLIVVAAIAFFVLREKNKGSTLPDDEQAFAVEDTSAISRIVLDDRSGHHIELKREEKGGWMVNGKYKVELSQLQTLMETIRLVAVKSPVPKAARDNVIKNLASTAIKVQIYKGDDLEKAYYVGGTTPDELGTLMLIDGAENPFVTAIPGFNGYLTPRYPTSEKVWRSTEIYRMDPSTIQQVDIRYLQEPKLSSRFKVDGDSYTVEPLEGKAEPKKVGSLTAKRFLSGFRNLHFEQFAQLEQQKQDSILASEPFIILSVKTAGGPQPPLLKLYLKQADIRTKSVDKNNVDQDKFYGVVGDDKEVVLVQTFAVGKLLPTYEELSK